MAVRYFQDDVEHGNIYSHIITDGVYSNLQDAMQKAVSDGIITQNPINQTAAVEETQSFVFFTVNRNNNFIMYSVEQIISN